MPYWPPGLDAMIPVTKRSAKRPAICLGEFLCHAVSPRALSRHASLRQVLSSRWRLASGCRRLPMRKRKAPVWLVTAVLAVLVAAGVVSRRAQHHPYLIFQATESLQMVFLQRPHGQSGDCETTTNRIADAVVRECSTCRLVEKRCLEQLDPRQRKILSGQPLDVPVMRTPGGVVAFLSTSPGFAQEVCGEAERQTAPGLSPQCARAGPD